MRNDGNRADAVFERRHGKADALDTYGTLISGVFFYLAGQFYPQPEVFRAGNPVEGNDRANAIHVALHDVPAEAAAGFHRQFQIDQSAFVYARERSTNPGLG